MDAFLDDETVALLNESPTLSSGASAVSDLPLTVLRLFARDKKK